MTDFYLSDFLFLAYSFYYSMLEYLSMMAKKGLDWMGVDWNWIYGN